MQAKIEKKKYIRKKKITIKKSAIFFIIIQANLNAIYKGGGKQ